MSVPCTLWAVRGTREPQIGFLDQQLLSLTSAVSLVPGAGFFMHFNSSAVSTGAMAVLESRTLYPKRGFQCLQFYLYNSGSGSDQLNIYIREYSAGSENGTVTLVEEIKGTVPTSSLCGSEGGSLNSARAPPTRGQGLGVIAVQLSSCSCGAMLWEGSCAVV